jgi:hypothetical protein
VKLLTDVEDHELIRVVNADQVRRHYPVNEETHSEDVLEGCRGCVGSRGGQYTV